jgi:hypothetical protein
VKNDSTERIVVFDSQNGSAKYDTKVHLESNTLYTLFGYCDSYGLTTWIVSGGSGGGNNSLDFIVDTKVIAGSPNAVSGGAVYNAIQEKIVNVDEEPSNPMKDVLYLITEK